MSGKIQFIKDMEAATFPAVRICDWRVYAIEPIHMGDVSIFTGVSAAAGGK